jgi:hypothetical protein
MQKLDMDKRGGKNVRFASNRVKVFAHSAQNSDIGIARDNIITFLKRTIDDVVNQLGQHYRNNENTDTINDMRLVRNVNKIIKQCGFEKIQKQITANILLHLGTPVHSLLGSVLKNHAENSIEYKSAVVLVAIGLDVFIKYNHCVNICYKAAQYNPEPDVNEIQISRYGHDNRDIVNSCLQFHQEVEELLGIEDIRLFDDILRDASKDKCSIVFVHKAASRSHGGAKVSAFPIQVSASASSSNAVVQHASTKEEIIDIIISVYDTINVIFATTNTAMDCTIKQIFLRHIKPKIRLPNRRVTTGIAIGARVTRSVTRPLLFSVLLKKILDRTPLKGLIDTKKLETEFFNKYMHELVRFVYDDDYTMNIRPLLIEMLPVLSRDSLLGIITMLRNTIQEHLLVPGGATCMIKSIAQRSTKKRAASQ